MAEELEALQRRGLRLEELLPSLRRCSARERGGFYAALYRAALRSRMLRVGLEVSRVKFAEQAVAHLLLELVRG